MVKRKRKPKRNKPRKRRRSLCPTFSFSLFPASPETERVSWKEAIAIILRENGIPMSVKNISDRAVNRFYNGTLASGKTPRSTVAGILSLECRSSEPLFYRQQRGIYGLVEWRGTTDSRNVGRASQRAKKPKRRISRRALRESAIRRRRREISTSSSSDSSDSESDSAGYESGIERDYDFRERERVDYNQTNAFPEILVELIGIDEEEESEDD